MTNAVTTLPDPREVPFVDVETAGRFTKLGRSKAYEMARRFLETGGAEGLPAVSFGRSIRVPVAALWRLAGLTPPGEREPAPAVESGAGVVPLVAAKAQGGRGGQ